jgi:hypothetical protein
MHIVDVIRKKYLALAPVMNEKVKRLWLATEAAAIGKGGVAIVTKATGVEHKRINAGARDLEELSRQPPAKEQPRSIRRPGGGRKSLVAKDPQLLVTLDNLISPLTRGNPESGLRWTCKSVRKLAAELVAAGHQVSPAKVGALLAEQRYSLQGNRKVKEGAAHPDRDAQFHYINDRAKLAQRQGQPVISVDTKKKELVGDFRNGGREWHPAGEPTPVRVHDFIDDTLGKAIPYGVYDLFRNEGWVNVGINHDTAEFAVASIRRWWQQMGRQHYPHARALMITADAGGSNGVRTRLWKRELQHFADETGLLLRVCHYPPGTSKWNKIEHRMFCHITKNWRGRPLETLETIVNLISATTTSKGLKVGASLDRKVYEKGVRVTDEEMEQLDLRDARTLGQWNYVIRPRSKE